jgi:hypothetical protein
LKRVNITPRRTASEFLTTANRLQISLAPDLVETDRPRTLNGGAAEPVLAMAEG